MDLQGTVEAVLTWLDFASYQVPNDPKLERKYLARARFRQDLNIEDTGTLPRRLLLLATGISEADCLDANLQGPLDDLNASNILAGPFKIELTSESYQHLTFAKLRNGWTLRVLDLQSIFKFYAIQRTGIVRYDK